MLSTFLGHIADHSILSTYLGVMVFNEGAILTAFSLASPADSWGLSGLVLASIAGALTNDLILYALARFGAERFFRKSDGTGPEPLHERVFLGSPFFALLGIKFLFGVRFVLTVYLVAKKCLPIVRFIIYDLCGIALYVFVIGGIGLLVGQGGAGVKNIYVLGIRTLTAVFVLLFVTHIVGRLLKHWTGRSVAE
ncbi:MAG: hypothetical protein WAT81_05780 [Candidatus Moraniibacteriota bacterium]